jgi:hypothetical protein
MCEKKLKVSKTFKSVQNIYHEKDSDLVLFTIRTEFFAIVNELLSNDQGGGVVQSSFKRLHIFAVAI